MGRKQQVAKPSKPFKPFVSVCTPTFNRRPFIPMMLDCFRNQTYPKDRMEWIIVDDGTDSIEDLIRAAEIPQIKYVRVEKKMSLGEKRNHMHKFAKGSIIVYMDDDDYYPPERVSHAVERLMSDKNALCAGSSEMYLYFKHINQMYQFGPYGPNHATAATFAFKSRLLDDTKYENHAALAEERAFLRDYTVPFIQLDPVKTILVFSHIHNTFDKKKLLDNQHPQYCKPSPKTVDTFISGNKSEETKKFFLEDIDALLAAYSPGDPSMKPDVLEQTKEIDRKMQQLKQEDMARQKQQGTIMMQREGQEPVSLTLADAAKIMQQQNSENAALRARIAELETQLAEKSVVAINI